MSRRIVVVALICFAALAGPAAAQESDDGLDLSVDARYRMEPDRRQIEVVLDAAATNTLTDAEDDFGVTRFFFDELVFAIPLEAENIVARDEVGELVVEVSDRASDGLSEAAVQLRSRLYSGQSRDVVLEFVLRATPARSPGEIRVDPAFGWFFLWAYGDPGRSTVTASIPPEFEVDVIGDELRRTSTESGARVLVSGAIDDPLAWVAVIAARNDSELVSSTFEIDGSTVELRAWPSDPAWARGVENLLSIGVPAMADLLGRQWSTDLVITESVGPSVHGFGGWYVDSLDSIEMGENLDAHLVLHEVSHAWFNDSLFVDRWITEGMADVYADAAAQAIGEPRWNQENVRRGDRGNLPLNEWADPAGAQQPPEAIEEYGYAASWHVIDQLTDEIGLDAMGSVLDAAWNDEIAYRGDAVLDLVDEDDDWRRFLDLLEEAGGSDSATELFDKWIVTTDQRELLVARADARTEYHRVEVMADEWALPPELRRSMGEWRFDDATAALSEVVRVLEQRERLRSMADRADVEPVSLEQRFEAGEEADVLVAEMQAQEVVASIILEADRVVEDERSVFESIGLFGSDVESELQRARREFAGGDLAAAREAAIAISDRVGGAESDGRVRSAIAVGVVMIAGAGTAVIRRRSRRALPTESVG